MKKSLVFALFLLMEASVAFSGICNVCGCDLGKKAVCSYEKQHVLLMRTIDWVLNEGLEYSEIEPVYYDGFIHSDLSFFQPVQEPYVPVFSLNVGGGDIRETQMLQFSRFEPLSGMSETFLTFQNIAEEWRRRVVDASVYPSGSQGFCEIWRQNYRFSIGMIPYDSHFYLNASICLTKLSFLPEALNLLGFSLTREVSHENPSLSFAIKRQMAFIYGLQREWEQALQIYRQIFPFGVEVGRFLIFINKAVEGVINSGVLPEDEVEIVRQWQFSLKSTPKCKDCFSFVPCTDQQQATYY